MDYVSLIVVMLASSRIAYALTQETVGHKLREFVFLRFPPPGVVDGIQWVTVKPKSREQFKRDRRDYKTAMIAWTDSGGKTSRPQKPDKFKFTDYVFRHPTMIGELFSCAWCMSAWTGLVGVLFWVADPEVAFYLSLPFALSMASILIYRVIDNG